VIVVDNGSTDRTGEILKAHSARFPVTLRSLVETQPGKSLALRTAVSAASGEVLAFTDDDVLVDPSWIGNIRAALGRRDVGLVGGPVHPRWERQPPPWLRHAARTYSRLSAPIAVLDYGRHEAELGPRTLLGANLAIKRRVYDLVGGFASNLGKLRGTLLSGEDHDLCRRVQAAGFRAVYVPEIRVRHWVPADRMRFRYHLSWFYWSGLTNAALDADAPALGRSLAGVPLYFVKRGITSAGAAAVAAGLGNRNRALDRAIDVVYAAGYIAGCRRRPQSSASSAPAGVRA
jgi:GT2 family glycosyltransferase